MAIDPNLKKELSNEAERIEEDSLFSGKGHYNSVARWRWAQHILGVLAPVASAIAATAVFKQWGLDWAIGAAAVATVSAAVSASLKPGEYADRHQRAGDRYFAVKNKARIFRRIELIGDSPEEKLKEAIKQMSQEVADIRSGAPLIPRHAYQKTKQEIEVDKTTEYRVDKGPA